MDEQVKVSVVEYTKRTYYLLQWRDPLTGKLKTKSSKVERPDIPDGMPKAKVAAMVAKAKAAAHEAAGKLESELREGRYQAPSRITWEAFRQRYAGEVLDGLAKTTVRKVNGIFNGVEEVLSPKRLADLNEQRLSYYQKVLRGRGRSEQTIKGHLAHLMASLSWAVRMKMLPKPPQVEMPKRAKATNSRTPMKGRPITLEEFERMLARVQQGLLMKRMTKGNPKPKAKPGRASKPRCKPPVSLKPRQVAPEIVASWRHYLEGLWLSGLRLAESLELWWPEKDGSRRNDRLYVDFSDKRPMLLVPAEMEKGHRDRSLPMAPEFAEFLQRTPAEQRRGRVFNPMPTREGAPRLTHHRVGEVVAKIGEAAGVKVRTETKRGRKPGEDREVVKYASAHDLRRSFGERWAARMMPQQLMEMMRHESIDTTLRYYVGRNATTTADAAWAAYEKATFNTCINRAPKSSSANEEAPTQTIVASGLTE